MTTRAGETIRTISLGERAPGFDLPASDGKRYSLASFADQPALVVIFSSNHCPYVAAWEDRMVAIAQEFAERGVAFVAINSSDAGKQREDSLEEMKRRAEEQAYPFPYLYDENQSAGRAYGATRTPEVFLFDEERHLRYHGAIDSDYEESSGMQNYLRDALNRIRTGQSIFLPETPPVGCPIKYQ